MITMMSSSFPKVAERGIGTSVMKSINRWQKQELSDTQLENVLERATRAVIQEQEQAGLDILTDGQIRWDDLVTPLARTGLPDRPSGSGHRSGYPDRPVLVPGSPPESPAPGRSPAAYPTAPASATG